MKLLVVSHSSNLGGAEVCFGQALRYFTGRTGIEIAAAYPDGVLAMDWERLCPRIPYQGSLPATFRPKGYLGWLVRGSSGRGSLKLELRSGGYDAVVLFSSVLTAPLRAAHECSVPSIVFVRERIAPAWVRGMLWRSIARSARRVVAVSESVAAEFAASTGRQAAVIHDGVEIPPPRAPFETAIDGLCVSFYGGYDRNKGGDIFVRAVARLAADHPHARFRYYGVARGPAVSGRFRRDVRSLANELGVATRIEFAETAAFAPTYAEAAVVVIASRNEALPLVALEAMAWGVPVVATAVGGLPGLLRSLDAGLLAPSENAQGLADAIGRVLDDGGLRASVGRRARRLVEAEYSRDASMAELERVITDAAGRGGGACMR